MYQMHRVFCANPWELEAERRAFYEIVGEFNEREAMRHGVLFVPVALRPGQDKRPYQFAVEENIRACRHFILLLSEGWGPVERNFESDYRLALQCVADKALPMRSVAVLGKRQLSGEPRPSVHDLAAGLPEPQATFSTTTEFGECLKALLASWLESLLAEPTDQPAEQGVSPRATDA
jgi:hypothetical protein